MKRLSFAGFIIASAAALAQDPPTPAGTEFGWATFQTRCMTCHGNPAVPRAPQPAVIRQMSPETIYEAVTTGKMKSQGDSLSDQQKRMLALFMSGRPLGSAKEGDAKNMPNHCDANPPMADPSSGPAWNGWGVDNTNTRFQSAKSAGLTLNEVPRLKLKWAFGYPTGLSAFGQPTVVSGRVFVGTDIGYIYSLDAKTGCIYWSYQTKGSVRSAISVGPVKGHGSAKYAVYFGDAHANAYALNAQTGEQLWMTKVDDHFIARVTGAPALYNGRLYVPVSSSEEFTASTLDYPCCTSRGSVAALDANTGKPIWKAYVFSDPKPIKKNSKGVQLYGPAGGSVWNSPTVDAKRRAVYFGTGDAETEPAPKTTDSIMAVDMNTGKKLWVYQAQENDAFLGGCDGPPTKTENCPSVQGPDLDIGNSPILRTLAGGKRVLINGTKDGNVFALDPDRNGALVWKVNVAKNPPGTPLQLLNGIVWGGAADEQNVYYGLTGGGMVAVRLTDGERKWFMALTPKVSNGAAASAIPGIAFVGGMDGKIQALATEDGRSLWQFDTAREFTTVNKVPAKGGGMGSAGPTIAGGMLFVGAGYGVIGGSPGNALLAFSVE